MLVLVESASTLDLEYGPGTGVPAGRGAVRVGVLQCTYTVSGFQGKAMVQLEALALAHWHWQPEPASAVSSDSESESLHIHN
jgi:hypothetical protein